MNQVVCKFFCVHAIQNAIIFSYALMNPFAWLLYFIA